MVAELGIVGRARGSKDSRTGIIKADFEFALRDRLFLHEQDQCVIHPMFFSKLNTRKGDNIIVFPFPDHPDFNLLHS
jgi:hypothetical protein